MVDLGESHQIVKLVSEVTSNEEVDSFSSDDESQIDSHIDTNTATGKEAIPEVNKLFNDSEVKMIGSQHLNADVAKSSHKIISLHSDYSSNVPVPIIRTNSKNSNIVNKTLPVFEEHTADVHTVSHESQKLFGGMSFKQSHDGVNQINSSAVTDTFVANIIDGSVVVSNCVEEFKSSLVHPISLPTLTRVDSGTTDNHVSPISTDRASTEALLQRGDIISTSTASSNAGKLSFESSKSPGGRVGIALAEAQAMDAKIVSSIQ